MENLDTLEFLPRLQMIATGCWSNFIISEHIGENEGAYHFSLQMVDKETGATIGYSCYKTLQEAIREAEAWNQTDMQHAQDFRTFGLVKETEVPDDA